MSTKTQRSTGRADLVRQLKEAREALEAAREELAQSERLSLLGQIAVGIGHELRQPLSVINSAAYSLRAVLKASSSESASAAVAAHLDRLDDQVAEASRVIATLMDYARTQRPQRRPVDLNLLVRQQAARLVVPGDVRCTTDLDSSLAPVLADPLHFERVFHILASNALDSLDSAGGEVLLRTFASGGRAVLEVKDSGTGVAEDLREKIFRPFFTSKSAGLGLGLALARQLVEANGGSISFSTETGVGSAFHVRFPAAT